MNLGVKSKARIKNKFKNAPKVIVTIRSFYKVIDRILNTENYGTLIGYRYIVSFIDESGTERFAASGKF